MDISRFPKQNLNNSMLNNAIAMPMKDSTSDGTSTFSMGRLNYVSSFTAQSPAQNPQKKWIGGNRDASQTVVKRRVNAIGLGSMANTTNSFVSNYSKNTVNDALRRVRGGGAVAPPKKAASPYIHPTPHFPVNKVEKNIIPHCPPTINKYIYGSKNPNLYH